MLKQYLKNLPILPALLQTATLALLTTSIPLNTTLTSTLIAVDADGELISDPKPAQLNNASSVHVLAFSTLGELLVVESEGDFTIGTWERVYARAEQVCCRRQDVGDVDDTDEDEYEDMHMETEAKVGSCKEDMLRIIIQEQVQKDQRWKQSST